MTKIGIIRCDENSSECAGWNCFPAIENKTGKFERYDTIELVGFDTCGGCGHGKPDKILKQARKLVKRGAEVIHLGNCLAGDCPSNRDIEAGQAVEPGHRPVLPTDGLPRHQGLRMGRAQGISYHRRF